MWMENESVVGTRDWMALFVRVVWSGMSGLWVVDDVINRCMGMKSCSWMVLYRFVMYSTMRCRVTNSMCTSMPMRARPKGLVAIMVL